ncbi:MAG: hypothetical protein KJZ86_01465 [Caldilineaceae bacterium]|nr:hypothetical protein [Caldilineaceae bacterium]
MGTIQNPIDYEGAIATLIWELPTERAAQLYDFARFLVEESRSGVTSSLAEDDISEEELAFEDAVWEASMTRHADRYAALKAQAKADVKAQKVVPMFDERGEFSVEMNAGEISLATRNVMGYTASHD